MIDWELRPLAGLGPLQFGMSRAAVSEILGPPRSNNIYSATDVREYRGKGPRTYDVILGFDPDRLTDATFPYQENGVSLFGMNVFATPSQDLVKTLKVRNGGSYAIHEGSLFAFEKLGVVLSDWLEADHNDKWIAVGSSVGFAILVGDGDAEKIIS